MKRTSIMLAAALLIGCADPTTPPDLPPLTPIALAGVIRNDDGSPVTGARVELLEPGSLARVGVVTTELSGRFRFQGITGSFLLRVSKSGYFHDSRRVDVAADVATDFQMRRLDSTAALPLGTVVHTTVEREFPSCAEFWNDIAPCRQLLFQAPATGTLSLQVSWSGPGEIDVLLVSLEASPDERSTTWGPSPAVLTGRVIAGHSYEVRVISWDGTQAFDLLATLNPTTAIP